MRSIALRRTSMNAPDITGTPIDVARRRRRRRRRASRSGRAAARNSRRSDARREAAQQRGRAPPDSACTGNRACRRRRRRRGASAPTSGMRVEPADAVGQRVGGELDVGVEHQVVVGAGAVQHQVVRGAVADVGVAVQADHVHAGVGEALRCRGRSRARRCSRSSLLSISARCTVCSTRRVARRADRERELAQRALEQREVGPVGDDADLERRRQHGCGRPYNGATAYCARRGYRRRGQETVMSHPPSTFAVVPLGPRHADARRSRCRRAATTPPRCARSRRVAAAHRRARRHRRATSPRCWSTATCSGHTTHGLALLRRISTEIEQGRDGEGGRARRRQRAHRPRRRGTGSGCPVRGSTLRALDAAIGDGARCTAPAPSSSAARITSPASPRT